ncbi:chitin synthesis regulation, resistance to congo red domain-containing protein [Purpureocillium lavendulum]|uniref:Chitin synthesis regulation, resistance to congo red domain-containing protein n=1 Tax=Purpureocillium lavendulum TaxID=1247861 RepID=A0AB34FTQ8_9HYPO|nr:chitin synthesis regulation, resistance to congo red domain-containing protein [Purpureocillium lavendulum]
MGVVGAAIKFIAIPITLVVLLAFVAFVVISIRNKKKGQKDIEQTETFTEFRLPQAPPPTYNKLPPQTTAMPPSGNHAGTGSS